MEKDISEIRNEINKVDAELLKAFEKRMSLANEVAEYKIKNNMPVYVKIAEDIKPSGAIYFARGTEKIFEDILGDENVEIKEA